MARSYVSFRAADLEPSKLRAVCSSYLAYEQARRVRSLLAWRLAVLLAVAWVLTRAIHLLPVVALITAGALAAGSIAITISVEVRARRRFARELRDVPVAGET